MLFDKTDAKSTTAKEYQEYNRQATHDNKSNSVLLYFEVVEVVRQLLRHASTKLCQVELQVLILVDESLDDVIRIDELELD